MKRGKGENQVKWKSARFPEFGPGQLGVFAEEIIGNDRINRSYFQSNV